MSINDPFVPKNFEVIALGPKHTSTGLVYPNGRPIFKVEYPEPIGFIHFLDLENEETS